MPIQEACIGLSVEYRGAELLMHPTGHQGVALLVYAPIAYLLLIENAFVLAIGGLVVMLGLAMLPDIDMRLPGVPHRGPTHTLLFSLLVGGVVAGFGFMTGHGLI